MEAGTDTVFPKLHKVHQPTNTNINTHTRHSKAGKADKSEVAGRQAEEAGADTVFHKVQQPTNTNTNTNTKMRQK